MAIPVTFLTQEIAGKKMGLMLELVDKDWMLDKRVINEDVKKHMTVAIEIAKKHWLTIRKDQSMLVVDPNNTTMIAYIPNNMELSIAHRELPKRLGFVMIEIQENPAPTQQTPPQTEDQQ